MQTNKKSGLREGWELARAAAAKWSAYDVPRLGAALAYYALLSLAPLLILIVAICDLVLSQSDAQQDLLNQLRSLIGDSGAQTVQMVIGNAHWASHGIFPSVVAILTLLFGASGVFIELQASLNMIWDVPPRRYSSWRDLVFQRLISFGMVLVLGFLLLFSLLLTTFVAVSEKLLSGFVPTQAANTFFSLVFMALVFALVFKFIPDRAIRWRDVVVGSVATSVLFTVGKYLLALYLATAGVGSTYGAAGSLVALIVWVYYSAQIFFYGALLTRVYADRRRTSTERGKNLRL